MNKKVKVDKSQYKFSNVYLKWFLFKSKEIKPQSADRIECTYNKRFRSSDIADMDIRTFDNFTVVNFFLDCINGGITKKEYSRILQVFVGVYNFAVDFLCVPDNLSWERIKKNIPRNRFVVNDKKEFALSENTFNSFSTVFLDDMELVDKPCATALLFCNFFLGLRIGELACLEWSNVDFENRLLYIWHTETKYHERDSYGNRTGRMIYDREATTKTLAGIRTVPLCEYAVLILKQIWSYQQAHGYESTYVGYDGTDCVMVRSLDRTLRKLCKEMNLPEFNSHLIRKTLVTRLHYAGVPTREISNFVGHSDISTTERNYIINMPDNYDYLRNSISALY